LLYINRRFKQQENNQAIKLYIQINFHLNRNCEIDLLKIKKEKRKKERKRGGKKIINNLLF